MNTYKCIDIGELVPKYIPEAVLDRFGDTTQVTFGDAYATLINAEQLCDILEDDFNVPFSVQDYNKEFGADTLIDLGG